ncbi:MAG: rhomboid family intramembrane serine protease [Planctomycetota bacterium]|nr:rhomboid family intramembrane serine protease [Planctomycetota bacterium]
MYRKFYDDFPVTSLLLLLVLGFFVLELVADQKFEGDPDAQPHVLLGSLAYFSTVEQHQYWRLVSAMFLHAGLLHIFFNAMVLFDLGRFCEPMVSPYKFFTIYMLSGIGGSLASLAYGYDADFALVREHFPESPERYSLGASGALCGLIGMLLVYSIKERHRQLRESLVRWVIFIAVFSFLPGIDHMGHIGGFVVGCLLGLTVKDYITSAEAERWRIPSYVLGAALGSSLILALWNYFSRIW